MSKETETTLPAIKEEIIDLANALKKEFEIGEGGVITVPKDLYEKTLPEGLTLADVKKVQEHNTALVAASALAVGEVGNAHFKKHKKDDRLSLEFKAGVDSISIDYQRSKEYPNFKDPEGPKIQKYGILTAGYESQAGVGSRGQLSRVKKNLAAKAAELLG